MKQRVLFVAWCGLRPEQGNAMVAQNGQSRQLEINTCAGIRFFPRWHNLVSAHLACCSWKGALAPHHTLLQNFI